MSADSLRSLFTPYFEVEVIISNSYMYQVSGVKQDGSVHSHDGFAHSHSHAGLDHSHGIGETPLEELLALMKFMVSHNDSHAQELAELASQLKDSGRNHAYRQLMDAVVNFDMANAQLDAVMKELEEEEYIIGITDEVINEFAKSDWVNISEEV